MKNEEKLKKLFTLMDEESLTKNDFLDAFENVVKLVKNIEKNNGEVIETLSNTFKSFQEKLTKDRDNNINEIKSITKAEDLKKIINEELSKLGENFNKKSLEIDNRLKLVKNGKDADEKRVERNVILRIYNQVKSGILQDVSKKIKFLSKEIRDSLESLKGDERLDVSAIKGLEDFIKKNSKVPQFIGGGSAVNYVFIDDETPSGTINGINKDFTINNFPSPATSLKVYRGGARQRLTEDYTFSGKTITFIIAPVSGEIITVDYRL